MDHRIDGFDCWAEIGSCAPNPDGSRLKTKASAQDLPVFAKVWTTTGTADKPDAWQYADLSSLMAHISRLTGLRDKMKLYSLRRGGQFVLVEHGVDRDTVRSLIGHETDSRADLAYISIVSTINVQALTKELPTTDVTNCPASVSVELRGRPRNRVSRLLSGSKRMTSTLNSSSPLR